MAATTARPAMPPTIGPTMEPLEAGCLVPLSPVSKVTFVQLATGHWHSVSMTFIVQEKPGLQTGEHTREDSGQVGWTGQFADIVNGYCAEREVIYSTNRIVS